MPRSSLTASFHWSGVSVGSFVAWELTVDETAVAALFGLAGSDAAMPEARATRGIAVDAAKAEQTAEYKKERSAVRTKNLNFRNGNFLCAHGALRRRSAINRRICTDASASAGFRKRWPRIGTGDVPMQALRLMKATAASQLSAFQIVPALAPGGSTAHSATGIAVWILTLPAPGIGDDLFQLETFCLPTEVVLNALA